MPTDVTTDKPRAGADSPRAIATLVDDHRVVQKLFDDYDKASKSRKREIVDEACMRLIVHTQIEEELFYPAVRGKVEEGEVEEALVEHEAAGRLIAELEEMEVGDELFDAKFKVLGEQVQHHVEEEEEGMFIEAQESDLDLEELGRKLDERKQALIEEFASRGEIQEE